MSNKFKIYIKIGFLFLGILFVFHSCQRDDEIVEKEISTGVREIISRSLSYDEIPNLTQVNKKLKQIKRGLNSSVLYRTLDSDSVTVLTDNVLYMTYAETHTYTFTLMSVNPQYYIENLILHYNVDTESYDEYLVQYDVTAEEYLAISQGEDLSESAEILISELDNGTLSGVLNRSNCFRVCETLCVPCSSDSAHECGDTSCEYDPSDDRAAYTYQSCGPICIDTGGENETIDDGDSGGGGGNGDVNTNPNPSEPCILVNGQVGIINTNGDCVKAKDLDSLNQDCTNPSGLTEIANTPEIKAEINRLKNLGAQNAVEDGKRYIYIGNAPADPTTYNDDNFSEVLPTSKFGNRLDFPPLANNTMVGCHFHPSQDLSLRPVRKIPSGLDIAEHINMIKKMALTSNDAASQVTNFVVSRGINSRTYVLRVTNVQNILNNTKDYTKDRNRRNLDKKLTNIIKTLGTTDWDAHETAFKTFLSENFPDLEILKALYDANGNIAKFCKLD
ncbi:hypothetical protein [Psychroserpens luteolus]|uniref:hypothetical protein n=1 Tax=Psychroserpens luteolus TaxID=2855840 RepID=UPI001E39430A|nr:hypothetical protein [Psychroserpens luteolus]MCD2259153.1 hypothetical protein [Psychroserpens luteolus]